MLRYSVDLKSDYKFLLHKNGRGKHIIEVDERLTNFLFFFLVNYLKYPEDIAYSPEISGFTKAKDTELFSEEELGHLIQVYVPNDDKGFDQVHVLTSFNVTYSIDFGSKQTKLNTTTSFVAPIFDINQITQTETITIPKHQDDSYFEQLNHKSFVKRFYIISSLYLLAFLFSTHFIDYTVYKRYFAFLLIMPFVWIFIEHDFLFKMSNYLKMLVFSILYLGLGYYSIQQNTITYDSIFCCLLTAPLFFLLYQKILSSLYVAVFKRKPDLMNNSNTVKYLYEVPLILFTIVTSLSLFNFFAHVLK